MAAHKIWEARCWGITTGDALELSELHLYAGGSRVDASATLTASAAPSSGTLANLKDDNTGTGTYWASGASALVLTWTFAAAVEVDQIVVGARTTVARFPYSLVLRGGDYNVAGTAVEFDDLLPFGGWLFVSAAKTAVQNPVSGELAPPVLQGDFDHYTPGGIGTVPVVVKREVLPATNPPTYVPQWAKVRLERDCDGLVVREAWSDPATGEVTFTGVDENFLYTVTAIYPDSGMRAVIADRIKPTGYPA